MQIASRKFWGSLLVSFLIGWALSYVTHTRFIQIDDRLPVEPSSIASAQKVTGEELNASKTAIDVPPYVLETLEYIFEHNQAPDGYVGGKIFRNREGLLPNANTNGEKYQYREWDVHPRESGKNRGAEGLVTSNKNDAYFTSDHYKSFIKLNK
jgi:ribonuclease T1